MTNLNKLRVANISLMLVGAVVLGGAGFTYVIDDGMSVETLMHFMIGGLSSFGFGVIGMAGCMIYEECCQPQPLARQDERIVLPPPPVTYQVAIVTLAPLPTIPTNRTSILESLIPKRKLQRK